MKARPEARPDVPAVELLGVGPVAIPVDGGLRVAADVHAVGVGFAVLDDVNFRARGRRVADELALVGRLQPEARPHARGGVELDARLQVAVTEAEVPVAGEDRAVIRAVSRVGREGQIAALDGDGVGDVDGIAVYPGPGPPLRAVERAAVEFVGPDQVITGGRVGWGAHRGHANQEESQPLEAASAGLCP